MARKDESLEKDTIMADSEAEMQEVTQQEAVDMFPEGIIVGAAEDTFEGSGILDLDGQEGNEDNVPEDVAEALSAENGEEYEDTGVSGLVSEDDTADQNVAQELGDVERRQARTSRRSYNMNMRDQEIYRNLVAQARAEDDKRHQASVDKRQAENTIVAQVQAAMKSRWVISGTVAAVEDRDDVVYAVVYLGDVRVEIPFREFFMQPPADLIQRRGENILLRQRQFLRKCLGARVFFIITDLKRDSSGDVVAIASRKQAGNTLAFRYFVTPGRLRVAQGDVVDADIIAVAPFSLTLCVHGIDLVVYNRDLTHRYVENMATMYAPGNKIKVKITKLVTDGGKIKAIAVSGRDPEWEGLKKNINRIRIGGIYAARVTSIRDQSRETGAVHQVVSLFLEQIELPAFSSVVKTKIGDQLKGGDLVQFEVAGVSDTSKYVHGQIVGKMSSR